MVESTLETKNFERKTAENRDLLQRLQERRLYLDLLDGRLTQLAKRVFELSQTLVAAWFRENCAVRRSILEMVCLNCELAGASLCVTRRSPFQTLGEIALVSGRVSDGTRTRDLKDHNLVL